ncbi:hypothetical protein CHS0354_020394 [Potamilus streckersoni]|uniref:Uncharacterized protein n=1 Tax=Potamilus streckersoni TaxID=2493646 RepID=A0AAE0TGX4_9BIVA|nr:hypothetical protein CHS0354_020394 [Potamilus streckersoni]
MVEREGTSDNRETTPQAGSSEKQMDHSPRDTAALSQRYLVRSFELIDLTPSAQMIRRANQEAENHYSVIASSLIHDSVCGKQLRYLLSFIIFKIAREIERAYGSEHVARRARQEETRWQQMQCQPLLILLCWQALTSCCSGAGEGGSTPASSCIFAVGSDWLTGIPQMADTLTGLYLSHPGSFVVEQTTLTAKYSF